MTLLWILLAAGCSSITNPVANGVPARLLPDELLAESVEELEATPLAWLRTKPPEEYRLAKGDIVGVYVDGALGDADQPPPINFPQVADLPPSSGFPIPVGEDGTVLLPLVNNVKVDGMTLAEAQVAITKAYTSGEKEYLPPDKGRILVTLVRPRQSRILIIREDAPNTRPNVNDTNYRLFGSAPSLGIRAQGSGTILELPEVEADVLSALAQTGGLPGPTAANEVVIYRGFSHVDGLNVPPDWNQGDAKPNGEQEPTAVHIPLRIKPGTERPFTEEQIRLRSGDIIFVPPRDTDVYYTGGLLPAREVPLPRDNDLRMVEAILRVGGSVVNGGSIVGNFNQTGAFLTGLQNSNPSLLTVIRKTPNQGQVIVRIDLNRALRDPRENLLVKPGDVLILQETPAESVSRYITSVTDVGIFTRIFTRGSATGQATLAVP